MTFKLKPLKAKPHFYSVCFSALQEIAKNLGYNLVIHGSMNRDMDLVAIPWVDNPHSHIELIESFVDYLGAYKHQEENLDRKKLLYGFNILPGGRSCYIINLNRGGGIYNSYQDEQYYLDISITPLLSLN